MKRFVVFFTVVFCIINVADAAYYNIYLPEGQMFFDGYAPGYYRLYVQQENGLHVQSNEVRLEDGAGATLSATWATVAITTPTGYFNGDHFKLFVPYVESQTVIVNYTTRNDSPDPAGVAVVVDGIEYLTTDVLPAYQTEADGLVVHSWAKVIFGDAPLSAIVRMYQDGVAVDSSSEIDFEQEAGTGNYISELHSVSYHREPDPRYSLSGTFQNGSSNSVVAKAVVYTTGGAEVVTLGTVPAGSYFQPSMSFLSHYGDLPEGETPTQFSFYLADSNGRAVATSGMIPFFYIEDRNIFYGSGSVSLSSLPPPSDPPPPPDPDDPANPLPPDGGGGGGGGGGGDGFDSDYIPPDFEGAPFSYSKVQQAIENAFGSSTEGGFESSYTNSAGEFTDPGGQESVISDIDSIGDTSVIGGWVAGFKSKVTGLFSLDLPDVGQNPVFERDLPSYLGVELPALRIDLDDFEFLSLARQLMVVLVGIMAMWKAVQILQWTFDK